MNEEFSLAVVQLCLPHYRNPLFASLSQTSELDFTVYAGAYSFKHSVTTSIVRSGINLHTVNNRFFLRDSLVWQSQFGRNILEADVVILEFNPRILSHFPILVARKLRRRPTLFWGIGFSANAQSGRIASSLRQLMARMADALIFYSQQGKSDFEAAGFDARKLFVATNAVNVTEINAAATKFVRNPQHILYAGRLVSLKKVDLLIKAFAQIVEQLPQETELIIIGDGIERTRLDSLASSLDVESRVRFVGEVSNVDTLASYFSQACVGVSPGRCGLFAVHSLAYGVPVLISADEPHGPEVKVLDEDINSRSFETDSVESLAAHLLTFFDDLPNALAMGRVGQAHVSETYSIEHMASVFIDAARYAIKNATAT